MPKMTDANKPINTGNSILDLIQFLHQQDKRQIEIIRERYQHLIKSVEQVANEDKPIRPIEWLGPYRLIRRDMDWLLNFIDTHLL